MAISRIELEKERDRLLKQLVAVEDVLKAYKPAKRKPRKKVAKKKVAKKTAKKKGKKDNPGVSAAAAAVADE